MVIPHESGIELEEDRRFQRRFWVVQRIAWIFMVLIVVAALFGFTGQGGKFAHGTVSNSVGSIDYPQISRWEASEEIHITLAGETSEQAMVEISSSFSTIFELEDIQPMPSESYATAEGQRLIFDLGAPTGRREIVMHVRAMRPSLGTKMRMRIGDGAVLAFQPLILP